MSPPVTSLPNVAGNPPPQIDEDRVAMSKEALKHAFLDNLFYIQGKFPALATKTDYYMALAYAVRDRMLQRWISTAAAYTKQGSRTVAYLSAEFLMGPHLGNNLINLGIYETARTAVAELGLDLEELLAHEDEPGLGNGGLGRLAACFIDSLATLEVPALGYGIRYEFGIFQQEIVDGWQVEKTDKWLRYGNPWELARPEWCCDVKFGGHTEVWYDEFGRKRTRWVPGHVVNGIPYDTPILGYHVNTANTLRLWKAEAPESFDFGTFNRGDYYGAVNQKVASENLTKVLYPNDEQARGKELRLEQQYFFVSLLTAGHAAHLQDPEDSAGALPREVRDPDERHASVDRRGGAHAPAGRRDGHGLGARLEPSRARPARTPTTRCCPRRSSAGRCRCSAGCCRASSRSSTRSTRATSMKCAWRSSATSRASRGCRSSTRPASATCAWRTWRASAVTPSTASRRCIPSCSRAMCSTTSRSCGRRSSPTRPTA